MQKPSLSNLDVLPSSWTSLLTNLMSSMLIQSLIKCIKGCNKSSLCILSFHYISDQISEASKQPIRLCLDHPPSWLIVDL